MTHFFQFKRRRQELELNMSMSVSGYHNTIGGHASLLATARVGCTLLQFWRLESALISTVRHSPLPKDCLTQLIELILPLHPSETS